MESRFINSHLLSLVLFHLRFTVQIQPQHDNQRTTTTKNSCFVTAYCHFICFASLCLHSIRSSHSFFFFNFSSADVVFVFSEFYFVQCIRLTKLLQDHAPCSHANSILPLKPFNLFIKPHGKNESGHAVYAVTFTCNNARKMTMCHDFFFVFSSLFNFLLSPFIVEFSLPLPFLLLPRHFIYLLNSNSYG